MSSFSPDSNDSSVDNLDTERASTPPVIEQPRFTKKEKWFIVILTACIGLFSPLTSSIYFPAVPTLSREFNKSIELINLTVTMYMVLQGAAPMVWGTASDHFGRRPISAACLLILTLSCVGLALVPTSAYWLLMLLRCVQAAGSASTIAIGAGVVGDISTREERGGFFGVFTAGPMIGPALGPVLGGLLAGHLGWRSIFWFLCIASAICLVFIIVLQPETLQRLHDNGRDTIPILYQPLIPIIGKNNPRKPKHDTPAKVPKNPFLLFKNPGVVVLLAINALICSVYYGVLAPLSTLFETAYPFLNEVTIGLCFLGIGGGMLIGSITMGRVLDWEYRKFKAQAERDLGDDKDLGLNPKFPIERARLRVLPFLAVIMTAACAGYGWCVQAKVNLAGSLILQMIVGAISISIMNATSTLMIDLAPKQSSSITACNNLVRCSFSAALVSVIDLMTTHLGIGWTYVLHGGLVFLSIPLLYLAMRIGPRVRAKAAASELQEAEQHI